MMVNDDSLTVEQNQDGSFTLEWDKEDPKWNFKWIDIQRNHYYD